MATRKVTAGSPPGRFQLKVTLAGPTPKIWRRLTTPADMTLGGLHWALQCAFCWTNSHLHQFHDPQGTYYSHPRFGLESARDESAVRLNELLLKPKDWLVYEYDFGDSWEHVVQLEKLLPSEPGKPIAVCTGGKRAAPPEDCGGVWGYAELLEVIRDPGHEEHEDRLDWLGGEFDPEHIDIDAINKQLRSAARGQ